MIKKFITAITIFSGFVLMAYANTLWQAKDSGVKIKFEIPAQKVTGTLGGLDLQLHWEDNLAASSIHATLDVNTLHTQDQDQDDYLLNTVFDTANHQEISFTSNKIAKADTGKGYIAYGTLEIKGKKNPADFVFTFQEMDNDGILKGSIDCNTSDYGLYPKPKQGKEDKDKMSITLLVPVKK